jgi:hypothetical protein
MDCKIAQPIGRKATFSARTLLPGIPDEIVDSVVWPKITAYFYVLNESMPEAEVQDIVQCIMRWK